MLEPRNAAAPAEDRGEAKIQQDGGSVPSLSDPTDNGIAYGRLIDALHNHGSKVTDRGGTAQAQCPAHDDGRPSLSVRRIEGQVLLHCFAGCATADIMAALHLHTRDLFDAPKGAQYRYDDGRTVYRSPDKRFYQNNVTTIPELYRRSKIEAAVHAEQAIYLVEGEKDVHALEALGVVATTGPMGAAGIATTDLTPLHGGIVTVVVDRDAAGRTWAGTVHHRLDGMCQSLSFMSAATGKDSSDHIAAGRGVEDFVKLNLDDIPAVDDDDDNPPGSSWRSLDLDATITGLIEGTLTRHAPTIGRLENGAHLFYAGKVNSIAGESGSGKTWTAMHVTGQQLADGHHVVYIDFEDDQIGAVGRLLDLGTDPDHVRTRFHYVQPAEAYSASAVEALTQVIRAHHPTFVVIDSTGESMALDGDKPNDDDDTARWFRRLPTAIAKTGPGVAVLDHVTKADGGLWAIGSQRKRAAVSGAQYMQTSVRPFSKGQPGAAKLVCAKDRHGNYPAGQRVADMKVTPDGPGVHITLEASSGAADAASTTFRPTTLMEHVSRAIEAAGEPLSFRAIDSMVKGKQQHVTTALDVLVTEGYVTRQGGPRRSNLHHSERPYRQLEDPESDSYSSASVTVSLPKDGERETDTRPPLGDGRETVGRQSPLPHELNENGGETVGRQSPFKSSSVSRVSPAQNDTQKPTRKVGHCLAHDRPHENGICVLCTYGPTGKSTA